MILARDGYGSNFNLITIENNTLIKQSLNEYGHSKLKTEIRFYKYLQEMQIQFKMPKIFLLDEINNVIKMEYLHNYIELYKIYSTLSYSVQQEILNKIYDYLHIIHTHSCIISKEQFYDDVINETQNKINARMACVKNIINKYSFVTNVNNIKLKTLDEIKIKINSNVMNYLNKLDKYEYSIIHGDCQFNNILINVERDDIIFIDPRGYFGDTPIFGLKEYDIAKIYFALSGYGKFDCSRIYELNIENDNIDVDLDIQFDIEKLIKQPFIASLMVSIWLGNSHMFINNELKCITSYFISILFGSICLF
jgi:tRNA A-37 threonylcarbamoyl transferase component Bud32